jgi:ABC-type nitrate/sulfonate/bicarbonate transport system substrate-binding protein
VLADFGVRWGDVLTSGVFVNASWAEAHPDRVRRYVRARVAANRRATDPVALAARAAQILGESDHWGAVAETYVASGYWPDDGGLTNELVDRSLTFFTRHGSLPGDLDADRAADVSFLTDALAELAAFPRERPGK